MHSYFAYMNVCVPHVCPWKSEDDVGSSGTGVKVVRCHADAGSWMQVLWDSNQCSQLLSHPLDLLYFNWKLFWLMSKSYPLPSFVFFLICSKHICFFCWMCCLLLLFFLISLMCLVIRDMDAFVWAFKVPFCQSVWKFGWYIVRRDPKYNHICVAKLMLMGPEMH